MELHQVAQHADDLDRAVAFYTGVLGCEVIGRFDPPGLAFLRLGPVRLLLEGNAPSALIYLRVDDVRTTVDELGAAGAGQRAGNGRCRAGRGGRAQRPSSASPASASPANEYGGHGPVSSTLSSGCAVAMPATAAVKTTLSAVSSR